jgi:nitrogen fixation-related uncharacterized protein
MAMRMLQLFMIVIVIVLVIVTADEWSILSGRYVDDRLVWAWSRRIGRLCRLVLFSKDSWENKGPEDEEDCPSMGEDGP